jgi:dienelactone hydrolase
MNILICHSVLGRRDVERAAAELLSGIGHVVSVPDMFGGATATSIDEGADIVARLGWHRVCAVAERALSELTPEAVLIGFSMGVGVASELWAKCGMPAGAVFLHALPTLSANAQAGFRFQVHLGGSDAAFADASAVEAMRILAERLNLPAEIFRYPGAHHFFTDRTMSDYDHNASTTTWERVIDYLSRQSAGHTK